MNINKFKEGDIVTRVEPCKYNFRETPDGSYLGDRIRFLGCEKKIILFQKLDGIFGDDIMELSFGRDPWDEGWDYYPEKLFQKIKAKFQKKEKKQT